MTDPKVLIEGVLFRARYLGSTQLVCEGQPTKATRMMQAEEAVSRIKVRTKRLHITERLRQKILEKRTCWLFFCLCSLARFILVSFGIGKLQILPNQTVEKSPYSVRSACKLRARRTEYKSVFFSYDINCWRKFGAYLA